jgi:pyruvate formate lyase activating enzyme
MAPGKLGICKVRQNINNKLYTWNYNKVSALNFDPIEKKPLYHFFPGKQVLSIGGVGCNLKCSFCQNCDISQVDPTKFKFYKEISSEKIIEMMDVHSDNIGVAYTYNEPTIWAEFLIEIAEKVKARGKQNVMVTNGFIDPTPLKDLLGLIDGFNVDLKAFSEGFYKKQTSSSLTPVKESLKTISKSNAHLEITHLVIPNLNDDLEEFKTMVNWISGELGSDSVLHLSRYFPMYKLHENKTPLETLTRFYEIAKEKIDHVYLGNTGSLMEGKDTLCPACNSLNISRKGYITETIRLDQNGNCSNCGEKIAILH